MLLSILSTAIIPLTVIVTKHYLKKNECNLQIGERNCLDSTTLDNSHKRGCRAHRAAVVDSWKRQKAQLIVNKRTTERAVSKVLRPLASRVKNPLNHPLPLLQNDQTIPRQSPNAERVNAADLTLFLHTVCK